MWDDETWQLGAVYKNLAWVRTSWSKFKVTRDKKRKTAESSPLTMRGKATCAL